MPYLDVPSLKNSWEFVGGAASWSRVERIIARVEVGAQGAVTRFVVTNLAGGKAKGKRQADPIWRGLR
ncbi:hypothetical protein [Mesorhizobium sp. M1156]|uniref:transposase n=1 Tax=Mesorhizobium sp. M1156 TaxID=2957064 RepID=UPI003335A841